MENSFETSGSGRSWTRALSFLGEHHKLAQGIHILNQLSFGKYPLDYGIELLRDPKFIKEYEELQLFLASTDIPTIEELANLLEITNTEEVKSRAVALREQFNAALRECVLSH